MVLIPFGTYSGNLEADFLMGLTSVGSRSTFTAPSGRRWKIYRLRSG